jgi:HSP20 family molecular chaperone IbpA
LLGATIDYYAMSVISTIWSPPSKANPNSPPNPHTMEMAHTSHHFHFPPTGLLAARNSFNSHLRTSGRRLSHAADGERGPAGKAGVVSSWSPRTDIRQTRLAYHIEIEVPGTTNKEELAIEWLSPSTLVVRGEVERPFVGHGKAAEGVFQFEQNEESTGEGYPNGNAPAAATGSRNNERPQEDGAHGHDVSGGGMSLNQKGLERQSSLKQNEHDGKHVPNGFTYQSSTGSKHVEGKTADDGGELKRMITDPADECADIPMFLLEERKTGLWQRTFTLPHDIDMKALKARLEGGLLRIDIPTGDGSGKPGVKVEIE